MPTTVHRYTIPNYRPTTTNDLLSTHPMRRSKLKRSDYDLVAWYGREIPMAEGKRRVTLNFIYTKWPFDVDAPLKSVLDALVACRLLRGDSPKWCQLGGVGFKKGEQPALEIVLEDME